MSTLIAPPLKLTIYVHFSVGGFDYTPDEPLPKEILNPGRELTKKLAGTNVYLVGMMGSGKTAVGEKLAQNLGPYTFLDTDGIITNLLPDDVTIQDYFDSEGEDSFRWVGVARRSGVVKVLLVIVVDDMSRSVETNTSRSKTCSFHDANTFTHQIASLLLPLLPPPSSHPPPPVSEKSSLRFSQAFTPTYVAWSVRAVV